MIIERDLTSDNLVQVLTIICDCFNIGMLSGGIRQMYLGIEIGHPVYATLFCNLVSVLVTSIVELLAIPFLNEIRVQTLVKSCATFYAIFHASAWLVMSVLRYLYIVHNDWVHKTFPEPKTLAAISIFSIYCIYGISISTIIPLFLVNGWPYRGVTEMEAASKIACTITVLASYICILGISSIFYFLILHQKGAIGKNCIGTLPSEAPVEDLAAVREISICNVHYST